jgi:hypothetical protein
MTNFEAVKGDISPFTADKIVIEKALIDAGLNLVDDYLPTKKEAIAKVSIAILMGFLALASESEGSFSQSFDKEGLKMKIDSLANLSGISVSGVSSNIIRDKSNLW